MVTTFPTFGTTLRFNQMKIRPHLRRRPDRVLNMPYNFAATQVHSRNSVECNSTCLANNFVKRALDEVEPTCLACFN